MTSSAVEHCSCGRPCIVYLTGTDTTVVDTDTSIDELNMPVEAWAKPISKSSCTEAPAASVVEVDMVLSVAVPPTGISQSHEDASTNVRKLSTSSKPCLTRPVSQEVVSEDSRIILLTSTDVKWGNVLASSAAAPDTCGHAIEVPLRKL